MKQFMHAAQPIRWSAGVGFCKNCMCTWILVSDLKMPSCTTWKQVIMQIIIRWASTIQMQLRSSQGIVLRLRTWRTHPQLGLQIRNLKIYRNQSVLTRGATLSQ